MLLVLLNRPRSIDGPDESFDTLREKGHYASADYVNRGEASALQNLDEKCGENFNISVAIFSHRASAFGWVIVFLNRSRLFIDRSLPCPLIYNLYEPRK